MAATASFTTSSLVNYGRSGYNKGNSDDDEQDKMRNYGRSGYNKDDKDDEDDKQH
ncbi:hypothetical protein MFIFM68171_05189 [Madurella fahalii]|uniref:Uncharacterized protein n=1 Tax=Madurella fahalii TaxID=1157608 RepID=A0ABQ0GB41_9PEZI